MQYFTVFNLMVLCIVATSHAFILKKEKENLAISAIGLVTNTKDSAVQKSEPIIEGIKGAAKSKWDFFKGIREAKIAAVKNAFASQYAKLAAFREAKKTFARNLINFNTTKLASGFSTVSNNVQGLHQYKKNLKDKATSLISSTANKVHSAFNNKKEWIPSIKIPASSHEVLLPVPTEDNTVNDYIKHEPIDLGKIHLPALGNITVHDHIKHEPIDLGKIHLPQIDLPQIHLPQIIPSEIPIKIFGEPQIPSQIPVQNYEEPQGHLVYGPPANTTEPTGIPL